MMWPRNPTALFSDDARENLVPALVFVVSAVQYLVSSVYHIEVADSRHVGCQYFKYISNAFGMEVV